MKRAQLVRHPMLRGLASAAIVVLGCGGSGGFLLPVAIAQQPMLQSARRIADGVVSQIPNLQKGQTLGDWKKGHPRDTVTLYEPEPEGSNNENWCADAASGQSIGGGLALTQDAYFYPPPMPEPPSLPTAATRSQLVDQCRLGHIVETVEVATASRGDSLLVDVLAGLTAALGAPAGHADTRPSLSGIGRKWASWQQSNVLIWATSQGSPMGSHNRAPDVLEEVVVLGNADWSGYRVDGPRQRASLDARLLAEHEVTTTRIKEALTLADADQTTESPIREALNLVEVKNGLSSYPTIPERAAIFDALDHWLTATAAFAAQRRAAALFVADQLVDLTGGPFWDLNERPLIRQRLEAQGARFEWNEPGGSYAYTHTWLKQARGADPTGRAGELAFLTLMEAGFVPSRACGERETGGYRAVLTQGAAFLRQHPRSAIASDIHFLMAQAYGDIIALANGAGDEYMPELQNKVTPARAQALEHYRIAFATAALTPRARDAWNDAWRIAAGLTPSQLSFFCTTD